jgi:hypothetical protein
VLGALETCLRDLGHRLKPGAALEAAGAAYAKTVAQPAQAQG